MTDWMYRDSLPLDMHPEGCTCGACGGEMPDFDEPFEDGEIERDGNLYCGACGMLAQHGDEEYEWCDHITGIHCAYNPPDSDDGYPHELFEEDYDDYDD